MNPSSNSSTATESSATSHAGRGRFDSGALIQRALLTNSPTGVLFNGATLLNMEQLRHGALQKDQQGWWLSVVDLSTQVSQVVRIPDQAVDVQLLDVAGDKIDYFVVTDISGEPVEILLKHRPMTTAELRQSFPDFLRSLIQPDNTTDLQRLAINTRMYSDPVYPFPMLNRPMAGQAQKASLDKVTVSRTITPIGPESPTYRVLQQMQTRGLSEQEMVRYCRTRMAEFLNKIVVHEPWYDAAEFRKIMEAEGEEFDLLWKFLQDVADQA